MDLQKVLIGVLVAGVGGVTAIFATATVGTLVAVVGTAIIIKHGLAD